MKRKHLRRTLNFFLVILMCLNIIYLMMCVGAGGVLNDLYFALHEMKELENNNLLNSPPDTISSITKREINLVHNSEGLQNYINEIEADIPKNERIFFSLLGLFLFTLIGRVCFRKSLSDGNKAYPHQITPHPSST